MTVICPTFFLESGTFFREYLLLLQFDDFLYLFFKVWSKDFLAYAFLISSMLQKRPPSSSSLGCISPS